MRTLSIGELQRNSSIVTNLKEAIKIVDKRKKRDVAIVYPIKDRKSGIVDKMAGKYKTIFSKKADYNKERDEALTKAFGEKYGFFG